MKPYILFTLEGEGDDIDYAPVGVVLGEANAEKLSKAFGVHWKESEGGFRLLALEATAEAVSHWEEGPTALLQLVKERGLGSFLP